MPYDAHGLQKMKIIGYADPKYSSKKGEYEVLVNPEKLDVAYTIEYEEKPAHGNIGTQMKFKKVNPAEMTFNFVFDGTGIIPGTEGKDVAEEISKLMKVICDFDGSIHRPYYCKMIWGNLASDHYYFTIFQGVLTQVTYQYKLFKPNGAPLRAMVVAKFKSAYEHGLRIAMERKSSPDLTHLRTVKEGDKLVLMTEEIYGTTDYYLEVARINGLDDFRQLQPGTQLYFPPIDQLSR
ncbi:MAG: LysM peptidoglycan-binding domain-containing protein [Sphingobacteriales bacterium]|jgi:hypothetical protein|nr:LysM peptidoglycan-binding domain-containing protein [Sphingobacteriales bacterium]MCC7222692.1 hypothetical protein [Chitinophagales bacterium]